MNVRKWEDILSLTAFGWLLLLLNMQADNLFFRWDLTEEKRYTISEATIRMLKQLDEPVYVEVFLEGDLNAEFKRLQKAIRETLDEFRLYSGGMVEFKFTDPNSAPTAATRNRLYQQLAAKGLPPTTLVDNIEGQRTQKVIFPGAVLTYQDREKAALLLKGNKAASPQEQLNQSVEGVEYELAQTIALLARKDRPTIGFTQGHGELTSTEMSDLMSALNERYIVDFPDLSQPFSPETFQALVVAQPKKPFTELEKFRLDQYVMQGGRVAFLIDPIQMNLDSLPIGGTYAFSFDLNIEDLIFRYGVRVNHALVQDQQASLIEVVVGNLGNQSNVRPLPWPYYIYFNTFGPHPAVRNLDAVLGKFVTPLDTVKAEGIRKTPLMLTSRYSRVRGMPSLISLDELKEAPRTELFNQSNIPVAWLLEGRFRSLFANRFPPAEARDGSEHLREGQQPGKVVVIGDADFIRSETDRRTGRLLPIDFDRFRQQSLSNKEFFLHLMATLTEEDGLITARNRQITLRPLDTIRLKEERLFWQVLNVTLPVVLSVVAGLGFLFIRRRRFAKP